MKKKLLLLTLLASTFFANAQNVGIGTTNPLARLHVTDSSVLFSADGNIPVTPGLPPIQGAGRRMMWYPDKAAFRAGYVVGGQWDQNNIGNYSFASGYGTTASGDFSTAMGQSAIASGIISTAMGINTTASGSISTAMGFHTNAKSMGETVIGLFNTDYTPTATGTDRLFSIGNGTNHLSRSDAMTVLKNGKTGIGTSTPLANLHVFSGASGNITPFSPLVVEGSHNTYINLLSPNANETAILFGKAENAASGGIVYNSFNTLNGFQFRANGNVTRMEIYSSGNAWLQGTLNQNSDLRLKKEIHQLQNSLQKITKLNGYNYYWKDAKADNSLQTGLLAQEVQKLFPQLVKEDKDGMLSVNYSGLIPVLIESIKEQQQQIDELKKLVEKLLKQ